METSTQLLCKRDQEKKLNTFYTFAIPFKADSKISQGLKKTHSQHLYLFFPPFLKKTCSCFSFRCNTRTLPAHVARLFGGERGMVLESAQPHKRAEPVKSYQMFGRSIKQDPTRFGETERGANPGNQKC